MTFSRQMGENGEDNWSGREHYLVEHTRRPSVRLVRSPILIRDYLSGEGEFPDDDPDELRLRPFNLFFAWAAIS